MKYTIVLLLALVIITNQDWGDEINFSIDTFLNYIQGNGYYEAINLVKCETTSDIAVEFCEILCESPHCDEVVRIYMTCNNFRLLTELKFRPSIKFLPSNPYRIDISDFRPIELHHPYYVYAQKVLTILERYKTIIQKPVRVFYPLIKEIITGKFKIGEKTGK